MKKHASNLGIKENLYGLFACMVTGRPWETVIKGIDKTRHSAEEKDLVQNNSALVLPHISDVLEQVDRQMLLILKTNDLIRGIESTLKTQDRMTAFWVMSKCCVHSVFKVEKNQIKLQNYNKIKKLSLSLHEYWEIFKLNIYYLYIGLINFGLITSIKQIL